MGWKLFSHMHLASNVHVSISGSWRSYGQLRGATGSSDRQRSRRLRLKLTERTHISIGSCVFSTLFASSAHGVLWAFFALKYFSPSQPSWRVTRATCPRSAEMKRKNCKKKKRKTFRTVPRLFPQTLYCFSHVTLTNNWELLKEKKIRRGKRCTIH